MKVSRVLYKYVDQQLTRKGRDEVHVRCANGHLNALVEYIDGWVRSCEDQLRHHVGPEAPGLPRMLQVLKDLSAYGEEHLRDQSGWGEPERLLPLFDDLGLTAPSEALTD